MESPTTRYRIRTTKLTVLPEGEPIYSEMATDIAIDDEGGGEFLLVSQDGDRFNLPRAISVTPAEWPVLREAIEQLINDIEARDAGKEGKA